MKNDELKMKNYEFAGGWIAPIGAGGSRAMMNCEL